MTLKLRTAVAVGLVLLSVLIVTQTTFALPERIGQVNDFGAALSEGTIVELERALSDTLASSGRDISVLIVRNMEGMSVEEYDDAITEAWGLDDRHVLLLIAVQESAVRISTGETVERNYPDQLLRSVVDGMIPFLAEGRFDTAVSQAVNRLLDFQNSGQADQGFFSGSVRLLFLGGILAVSLILFLLLNA